MYPLLPALAATAALLPDGGEAIIVTAAREPLAQEDVPASSTVIGQDEIILLGLPLAVDLLRLVPGIAVATSGPAGSQTQVRIRGAEANHTLLFVDGIKFNDPASGNEARFELLTNNSLARIEVVRGPQSALWGSEALGGVIAAETPDPSLPHVHLLGEYGSFDGSRGAAAFTSGGRAAIGAAASWLRSDGIDALGAHGDKDGYENRSASVKAAFEPSTTFSAGLVGHWIEGTSQFDGYEDFVRADTRDASRNRILAGRGWTRIEWGNVPKWRLDLDASLLDSANGNRLAATPLNRSAGRRTTGGVQLSSNLAVGGTRHSFSAAVQHEVETFAAEDQVYFGATDQHRRRHLTGLAGEWRAEWTDRLTSDVALRHDAFSAFANATTLRASLLFRPAPHWRLHANYGEGIAQPTFYDLYGFFPGSFVGNPVLQPERSRGWETGVHWSDARTSVGLTGFAAQLQAEIIDTFDPATLLSGTANADGTSHRRGVELEGTRAIGSKGLVSLVYSYLDADERQAASAVQSREVRRPRHSGSATLALPLGAVQLGASIAYVGGRIDTDFDMFPARRVKLGDYWLGSLNLAWRVGKKFELYGRMENAFDARYQDVVGYATAGRTVYAGIRLRRGD